MLGLLFVFLFSGSLAATPEEWRSRTIYQALIDRFAVTNSSGNPNCDLHNYCGGTWKGLKSKLDYIQGMGFDAIWISPVVKNTPGGYHGFWAEDLTQLNDHFGTPDDLIDLINTCHKRGMFVMVGVVANHMGPVGFDYSTIVPFNKPEHYHTCDGCPSHCNIDFNNGNQWQVENCRLAGLPDLAQENDFVRITLQSWVSSLVSTYNLDGVRVDTVPEVPLDFWFKFQHSASVYTLGEVFDGRVEYLAPYQNALSSLLSYPLYFDIKNSFASKQSMRQLHNREMEYQQKMRDPSVLGTFVDNHDNARFLSQQSDLWLYKNALTYCLTATGIPIIYYGTEQAFHGGDDPFNRETLWNSGYNTNSEMYQFLKTVINFRKKFQIAALEQQQRYIDDQFYAYSRGNSSLILVTNIGGGQDLTRLITSHPFKTGTRICNIFYPTQDCIEVNGNIPITLLHGESKVYVPA